MRSHRRAGRCWRRGRGESGRGGGGAPRPEGPAGNAAVARMLAAKSVMRAGWTKSEGGGWNEKEKAVQGTLRIPIQGLSVGNEDAAEDKQQTNEIAGAKD